MSRKAAAISVNQLRDKIEAVGGVRDVFYKVKKDIKVDFDLENVADTDFDFGPEGLMGYRTEPNGLTYCGMAAGGDWEHPVYWLVYWDGRSLRGYVPTDGNPWNTDTKRAYGNDEVADGINAHKRWPELYDGSPNDDVGGFDPDAIRKDILARIKPGVELSLSDHIGKLNDEFEDRFGAMTDEWTEAFNCAYRLARHLLDGPKCKLLDELVAWMQGAVNAPNGYEE